MRSTKNVKMSILDPLTCGFAKIALYNIFKNRDIKRHQDEGDKIYKARLLEHQFSKYKELFQTTAYEVSRKKICR